MKTNSVHFEKIRTLSKPALAFILKMLALLTILKCLFFLYNFTAGSGWQINHFKTAITIIFWSAIYDIFTISSISLAMPALFYLLKEYRPAVWLVAIMFSAILGFMVFLNLADVFYYPYVLQRSNNELIYELRNPLHNISPLYLSISILGVAIFFIISLLIYRWIRKLVSSQRRLSNPVSSLVIFGIPVLLFLVTGTRKILPTYPLVYLKSNQLPLAQNSFHQFIYSVYRGKNAQITIPDYSKLNPEISSFSLIKKNKETGDTSQRNVVLFIMESVPHDFFDTASRYKVKMPFLDSLVTKSLFFNKSYCYSHQSNKGIVAILASTPTLTDIPLYHSSYTNIPMTHVGSSLASRGYHSAFFIGDNYDDFGFAKCVNWLGIQKYYCMADIPGHQNMKKHTMGLQDEYVLNFMGDKINAMRQPFFAVNFNISTHYPYDIPADFK